MKEYGPDGRRYPVAPGEWWRCGLHWWLCAEWPLKPHAPLPMEPELIYCDPPWTNALLSGFYTKADRSRPGHGVLALYRSIASYGYGLPRFMEGSTTMAERITQTCGITAQWPITYYRRAPGVLFYTGPGLPDGFDPSGLDDDDTPGAVLAAYRPGVVLDPTAGRGLTSRHAEKLGWASVNIELSPVRMSVGLARLSRVNGRKPERIEFAHGGRRR